MAAFATLPPAATLRMPKYIPYVPPLPKSTCKPKPKTPKSPERNSCTGSDPLLDDEWTNIDDILNDIPDQNMANVNVEAGLPQTPQSLPHIEEISRQLISVSQIGVGTAGPFDGSSPEFAIVMEDDPEDLDNASDHDADDVDFRTQSVESAIGNQACDGQFSIENQTMHIEGQGLEQDHLPNDDTTTKISQPLTHKRRRFPSANATAPGCTLQLDQEGRPAKRSRIFCPPSESVSSSIHDSQSALLLHGYEDHTLDDDLSSIGEAGSNTRQETHDEQLPQLESRRQQDPPSNSVRNDQHDNITSEIQQRDDDDDDGSTNQCEESEFDGEGGSHDVPTFAELSTGDASIASLQESKRKSKHKGERKSKHKSKHKSKYKVQQHSLKQSRQSGLSHSSIYDTESQAAHPSETGAARRPDIIDQESKPHQGCKPDSQLNDISLCPVPAGASLVTALVHANSAPILSSDCVAALSNDLLGASGQLVRMAQLSSGSWLLVGYRLCNSNVSGSSFGTSSTQPAKAVNRDTISRNQLDETTISKVNDQDDVEDEVEDEVEDDVGSQKSDTDTDSLGALKMRRGRWKRLDEERLRAYVLEKKSWPWIAKRLRRTVRCVKKKWDNMQDE